MKDKDIKKRLKALEDRVQQLEQLQNIWDISIHKRVGLCPDCGGTVAAHTPYCPRIQTTAYSADSICEECIKDNIPEHTICPHRTILI